MNDSLGDDPRTWPDDPYVLFGVPQGVDARALRLAYNRLLRRFHPERFPEHFQRIREEYEWLQRTIESQSSDEVSSASNQLVRPASSNFPALVPRVETGEPENSQCNSLPIDAPGSLSDAWQCAVRGELSEAYRLTRHYVAQRPDDCNAYLCLYWLLRIQPELDPKQFAIDWLQAAIVRTGTGSPAWWLYRGVLKIDAKESLSARCTKILVSLQDEGDLRALLSDRWEAAADAGLWSMVRLDLEQLRMRRDIDDQRSWTLLQLRVIDIVAWSNSVEARKIFEEAKAELSQIAILSGDTESDYLLDHSLHRYDLLMELIAEYFRGGLYSVPDQTRRLMELVRRLWTESPSTVRHDAIELIDKWVENPQKALDFLDEFARRFPLCLNFLCDCFQRLAPDDPHESRDERLQQKRPMIEAALHLSHRTSLGSRRDFRRDMLRLVIIEGIRFDDLVTVGTEVAPRGTITWYCEDLQNDVAFRLLLTAFEVYWRCQDG